MGEKHEAWRGAEQREQADRLVGGAGRTRELSVLLQHLSTERQHVLAAVDGLGEEDLTRVAAPSGWSIAQLLNHPTYDDEIFWGAAIVGGDQEAIARIQDGWKVPVASGAETVERYRYWSGRVDMLLDGHQHLVVDSSPT